MKKVAVRVDDGTHARLIETVEPTHLSELPEGVKEVVGDFIQENEGVVLPPVSIHVTEAKPSKVEVENAPP